MPAIAPPTNSPGSIGPLELFLRAAPSEFFRKLRQEAKLRKENGVFTTILVIYLMIRQRLEPNGTLARMVQEVITGSPAALLRPHKRLTEGTLSPNTGAYCKARQRLDPEVTKMVFDRIYEYLIADRREALPGLGLEAFLIDGSSVDTAASDELLQAFPPAQNQHGDAHFPVLRIVVAHNLVSGIAARPRWGPMYGENAVSEQSLAIELLADLPKPSVTVLDRNFGIFYYTYHASVNRLFVLIRLTDTRARYLLKGKLPQEVDQAVDWVPSPYDRRSHPDLPDDAHISGRVIGHRMERDGKSIQLYFFTTLMDLSVDQGVTLYGHRWNIETDLRSLKHTVNLHTLDCQSVDMVTKELILAVAAYNLVRGTICAAAHMAGLEPRELSFSQVHAVVHAHLRLLHAATSEEESGRVIQRMLQVAARCRLPRRRSQRPSYPRAVWGHRSAFPKRRKKHERRSPSAN